MSDEEEAERKIKDKEGGRWLRDHGLQLIVFLASMLTATCYLVGRAGLLGWYETAGVPSLMFSWPAQDVIIRGFVDAETWLIVLITLVGAALYIILLEVIPALLLRLARTWGQLFTPTLAPDQVRKWLGSKRQILGARLARFRPNPEITAQAEKNDKKGKGLITSLVLGSLAAMFLLGGLAGLYFLAGMLLFDRPYRAGAQAFKVQYLAATGRLPPDADGEDSKPKKPPVKHGIVNEAVLSEGKKQLGQYAFVKLIEAGAGQPNCGWLVQATGTQVLLLTAEGLLMKNFGGGAYEWRTSTPGSCSRPSQIEIKTEAQAVGAK